MTAIVYSPLWGVPREIQRDEAQFVRRNSMNFAKIHALLLKYHRVTLHGPRGSGKSEVVTSIVWEAKEQYNLYRGIFWINASSKSTLEAGLHKVAVALKLIDETDNRPPQVIRERVLEVLEREDQWLLVLDDAQVEANHLRELLPPKKDQQHVLLTARLGFSAQLRTHDVRLDDMDIAEGCDLFRNYFRGNLVPAPRDVSELVVELGCLPIAVVQVARYLTSSGNSIRDFLNKYNTNKHVWSWESPTDEDLSYAQFATVVSVFFQNLINPQSIHLLCKLSYLNSESIPSLLWCTNGQYPDADDMQALQPLLDFALVTSSDAGFLSIPPLIQDIVRNAIDGVPTRDDGVNGRRPQPPKLLTLGRAERTSKYWLERTIQTLYNAYHSDLLRWDEGCELLKPHAFRCIELCQEYNMGYYPLLAEIYYELADYLGDFCGQDESVELFITAFDIYERKQDKRCADIALCIARCYAHQGQYAEALTWYSQVDKLSSRRGSAWSSILRVIILVDTGNIKLNNGDSSSALEDFSTALRRARMYSNNQSMDFGIAYVSAAIGQYWAIQGKSLLSVEHLERASNIMSQIYDDIDTGAINPSLEKYTRAFCFRRKIDMYLKDLTDYALCAHYGNLLRQLGRLDQAVDVYERARISGLKSVKYLDFHDMVITFRDYGLVLGERNNSNDLDVACEMLKQGLAILEKGFRGSQGQKAEIKSMATGEILEIQLCQSIAEICYTQENYDEALEWLTRAISATTDTENSVEIASVFAATGRVNYGQSNYMAAIEMFKKAQTIYSERKVFFLLGGEVTTWIVDAYLELGLHSEALDHCELVGETLIAELGESEAFVHYSMALTLESYAKVARHNSIADAVDFLEHAYKIYQNCVGEDHPQTKTCAEKLAAEREKVNRTTATEQEPGNTDSLLEAFGYLLLQRLLQQPEAIPNTETRRQQIYPVESDAEDDIVLPVPSLTY